MTENLNDLVESIKDFCVKVFYQSQNMISNVPQCDFRYYQGHQVVAEKVLKLMSLDYRGKPLEGGSPDIINDMVDRLEALTEIKNIAASLTIEKTGETGAIIGVHGGYVEARMLTHALEKLEKLDKENV